MRIRGPTSDGWGGIIAYSDDARKTYSPMHCPSCGKNCASCKDAEDSGKFGADKDKDHGGWKGWNACLEGTFCEVTKSRPAPAATTSQAPKTFPGVPGGPPLKI